MSEQPKKSGTKQLITIALTLILLGTGISMIYKHFHPETNIEANITPDIDNQAIVVEENEPDDQTLEEIIDAQDTDLADPTDEETDSGHEAEPIVSGPKEEDDDVVSTSHSRRSTSEEIIGSNSNDDPSGKYMVIAGSYSSIGNARKSLERTIVAGFQEAEIVNFRDSKYHTVCAIRTDDKETANKAVTKLKRKHIDAFLHIQRNGR